MSAAAASPSGGECVKVCVRIRPLSSKEKEDGRAVCVTETGARAEIRMTNAASPEPRLFTFDYTFGENALQSKIYSVSASPIVGAWRGVRWGGCLPGMLRAVAKSTELAEVVKAGDSGAL